MASTAVSSADVVVVHSGVDSRSAVYDRYNNGPRTLVLGYVRIEWGDLCIFSFNPKEEVSAMQIRF
jgi:hypothetical protein